MMNRYWKLIVLFTVSLLTFGIYYVQGALAKEELPTLELVTIMDKNDIAEDITIEGYYDDDMGGKDFELSTKGIKSYSEFGYFKRLNSFYHHSVLERLTKEYHGFMRGKNELELFYEDDKQLVYVGPFSQGSDRSTFKVDILDKETNDREKFSVKVPQEVAFEYMSISEVQVAGDKIYVFTSSYYQDSQQLDVYEIDMNDKKITDYQTLESISEQGNIETLTDYDDITKKPYLMYLVEKVKWDEATLEEERISLEFKSFHIASGEQKTITPPSEWKAIAEINNTEGVDFDIYSMNNYIVKDEFIYFIMDAEDGIDVFPYHLEKNELQEKRHIALDLPDNGHIAGYFSDSGLLSVIHSAGRSGSDVSKLLVIDPENGEIHYEGEIKVTNAGKKMPVSYIDFYTLRIH